MPLWASHPRIFLDVVNQDEAMCPYCGTRYRLKRGALVGDHQFGRLNLHQHRRQQHTRELPSGAQASAHRLAHFRVTPSLTADALGNTTLELMTQWLKRPR
jgi:hypothetical protein